MLTLKWFNLFLFVVKYANYMKAIPYAWNPKLCRLEHKTSLLTWHLTIFTYWFQAIVILVSFTREILLSYKSNVGDQVTALLYLTAYSIAITFQICLLQHRGRILCFVNEYLEYFNSMECMNLSIQSLIMPKQLLINHILKSFAFKLRWIFQA